MRQAVTAYMEEVRSSVFPAEEHTYKIDESVIEQLKGTN